MEGTWITTGVESILGVVDSLVTAVTTNATLSLFLVGSIVFMGIGIFKAVRG